MSNKKRKIRWTRSDSTLLERTVRNFNAKINRVRRIHPEWADYQPTPVNYYDIRSSIESRAHFKRTINKLKRYSTRGLETPVKSERGAKMTKWAEKEFLLNQRIDNANRTKMRKNVEATEVKVAGKGQGKTRAQMGDIKENILKPRLLNPLKMTQKEWERATAAIDERLRPAYYSDKLETMRENYIKGLIDSNVMGRYPEIEQWIRSLSPEEFYEVAETDETATFNFYKAPESYETIIQGVRSAWMFPYVENHLKHKIIKGVAQINDKQVAKFQKWVEKEDTEVFYQLANDKTPSQLFQYWKNDHGQKQKGR